MTVTEAQRTVTLHLRGEAFEIFPERAVLHRSRGALLVSDLHWGRETFMQSRGIAMPDVTLVEEMARLEKALVLSGAHELWILGDWVHHPQGIGERVREKMRDWIHARHREGIRMRFVPGNHDRKVAEWLDTESVEIEPRGIRENGFRFDHEGNRPGEARHSDYVISGHLHPALSLYSRVDRLKLHCFWARPDAAFLPAFSQLAGGVTIDPDFKRDQVVVLTPDKSVMVTAPL